MNNESVNNLFPHFKWENQTQKRKQESLGELQ